jgi:type II secretory pathway component GspD/PulD (secretin)
VPRLRALVLAALAAGLPACTSTTPPRPERDLSIATNSPPQEEARVEPPSDIGRMMMLPGGRASKMYFLKAGKGTVLMKLIKDLLKLGDVALIENFESNNQATNPRAPDGPPLPRSACDLMVVTASTDEIALVDEFLDIVEGQMPQVEIKARVVEIIRGNTREVGITTDVKEDPAHPGTLFRDYLGRFNTDAFLASLNPGNVGGFQGAILRLGSLQNKIDMNLVIELIEQQTQAEVLSAPSVRVLNGYMAQIRTGDKTPVSKVVITATSSVVGAEYMDTGVTLNVSPWIVSKDTIRLEIRPEVSAVTGFAPVQTSAGLVGNPIISTRNATTTVNVRDGEIFVLGGLLVNNDVESVRKIPLLGDLPLIGAFFRFTRKQKVRSELLFLIQPRILADLPLEGEKTVLPPAERR